MSISVSTAPMLSTKTLASAPTSEVSSASAGDAPAAKSVSPTVQISDAAKSLNDLFGAASKSVRQDYVKPFSGYENGQLTAGAAIDVQKYNNYLFDKAADSVVKGALEQGVSLLKDDVVPQLKDANKDVSTLSQSSADRNKALGTNSVLNRLSDSDTSKLTDLYIAAHESGMSVDIGAVAAFKATSTIGSVDPNVKAWDAAAFKAKYGAITAESVMQAKQSNFSDGTGEASVASPASASIAELTKGQKANLAGKYGLDASFMSFLASAQPGNSLIGDVTKFVADIAAFDQRS